MPTYKYEAMDTSGGEVKDSVEAASEEEAQQKIRQMGYFVTKITEMAGGKTMTTRTSQKPDSTVHTPGDAIQSTHNTTMPIDSAMLVAPRPKWCASADRVSPTSRGAMGLCQTVSSAIATIPRPSV